jgi:hypothetical protein
MRIIVDINHPGHVHFFKNFIWEAGRRGHQVLITASDKDIALNLLEEYGFEYENMGTYGSSFASKLFNLFILDWRMLKTVRRFKPDICMGIASARAAHAAFLSPGVKSYIFDDTDHATWQIAAYRRFADKIFIPDCFKGELKGPVTRYAGFHELAYLHPVYFTPEPAVLDEAGLAEGDPFFILRFISWQATHDMGHKGFTLKGKRRLIDRLKQFGRVLITSEAPLPEEFEEYRISLPPTRIHSLMYYARIYIGEGGTMASEAAVMGTPSIMVKDIDAGTFADLRENYGLMLRYDDENEAMGKIDTMLENENLKEEWRSRRDAMLENKINVTEWMLGLAGVSL